MNNYKTITIRYMRILFITLCLFNYLCILFASRLEYRIQNGYPVNLGEFPMIVLLLGNTHLCTGTIIAPDKILTAGHCACGDPTYEVHANLTKIDERFTPYTQFRLGAYFNYPESYKSQCEQLNIGSTGSHDHLGGSPDIAILTLTKKLSISKGWIEIASLNYNFSFIENDGQQQQEDMNNDYFILGYGEDTTQGESIGQLRFGLLKLQECPKHIKIPTDGALCSNINSNNQGPDVGDSGGPIFDKNGQVVGVTSIAGSGWYVFSSVTTHKEFIQQHLPAEYKLDSINDKKISSMDSSTSSMGLSTSTMVSSTSSIDSSTSSMGSSTSPIDTSTISMDFSTSLMNYSTISTNPSTSSMDSSTISISPSISFMNSSTSLMNSSMSLMNSSTSSMNSTTSPLDSSTISTNSSTISMDSSISLIDTSTSSIDSSTISMSPSISLMNSSTSSMNSSTSSMNSSTTSTNPSTISTNSSTISMNSSTISVDSSTSPMGLSTSPIDSSTISTNSSTISMNSSTNSTDIP
ncbi:unnamed protein product [Schistosoma turkestanicum]|nr:unnamed protein product [Schistosoma turkestanicum]